MVKVSRPVSPEAVARPSVHLVSAPMPTEIALVDGTKFQIAEDVRAAMELIGYPNPGWIYINEGAGNRDDPLVAFS